MSKRKKKKKRFKKFAKFPIPGEVVGALEEQRESFREKFGREPGPEDPVFFDPDADEPRLLDPNKMKGAMLEAAHNAGLKTATIEFIERNFDKDAAFECPQCGTEIVAWALAHPICPQCSHRSMKRKIVVTK